MTEERRIALTFLPGGRSFALDRSRAVLDVARGHGVVIESPCNGQGTCGKCRVRVVSGDVSEPGPDEYAHIPEPDIDAGVRLACRCKVRGEVSVEVPSPAERVRVVSESLAPAVVPDPAEPGRFGLAVDLGTTSVALSLVELADGREAASVAGENPQVAYGADILSRVAHVQGRPEALAELARLARAAVAGLAALACDQAGVTPAAVDRVAVACNPAMAHLLLGRDPAGLGASPFTPAFTGGVMVPAAELDIPASPGAEVHVLPVVSAFIGGDVVAGLLAARLDRSARTELFIDVGTNAEIVLAHAGRLHATSAPAGPAFEGMSLSCGMRAVAGAVDRVDADREGVRVRTVEDAPPAGLCGTGALDAVAELAVVGVIDATGRLVAEPGSWEGRVRDGGERRFVLAEGRRGEVSLSQKDVRHVQLAKGAVLAGVLALLDRVGVPPAEVERVYLAGAFGRRARPETLGRLRMLPPECAERVVLAGDTALAGATLALLSSAERAEAERLAARIESLDLAADPGFARLFAECLSLGPADRL